MGKVVIPGFRKIETSGSGEGGTTNYNDLINKPSINNVPLSGNMNTVDLHLTDPTLTEEGVPAEAKTVGDKLDEHSTSLTALKEEIIRKANSSDIPTKVSDLQNDSNYQTDTDVTNTLTTYATKTYVGEQISNADHLRREIVTEIPSSETADKNTIYMLKIESAMGNDKYREYLLIDGTVQCIGDTSVDLTDYAKKTEIPTELPANGGNSSTVNGHTVNSDVPANAKFTDTVYDDTEVKEDVDILKKETTVNLLNPTLQTTTQNGVTCTNNGDGTYTLNGTASDIAVFILQSNIEIASGKYKLTGCPQGGSTTSFKLDFEYKGNSTGADYGNGSIINKTSNDIFKYLRIVIYTGAILNNAVFKPMLTTNLSATYNDFVSYTGNTGRLNADVALLKNELNNNISTVVPSTYDDGSIFQKDFLNVNLSNKYNSLNLSYYFKISLGTTSQYKNLPSSGWTNTDVYGLRKVFFFEKNIVGVEVIEFYPIPGKRYYNMYIGADSKYWTGWKAYLPV